MTRFPDCTLALVAGGRARRLGGISKPHLRYEDGRTILVNLLESVAPLVDDVLVVSDDPGGFRGLTVVRDVVPGKGAPGGIYTALAAARSEWVLVLAADLPFVDPDVLAALWERRGEADAVAFTRDGRAEPLHAFYRAQACAPAFGEALGRGDPAAQELLGLVNARLVPVDEKAARSLENVNTPADVVRLGLRLPKKDPALKASAVRRVRRLRDGALGREEEDRVAIEEPLEIRIDGDTVAVTMRTPGDDPKLVLGFLLAEGLIEGLDDVGRLAPCGKPGVEGAENVIDVRSAAGRVIDPERVLQGRRWTTTSSACGVCGRQGIADLLARVPRISTGNRLDPELVLACAARLRELQPAFARTGGVHAAAAFDAEGRVLACHEDVGRHNAVDKTVGALLLERRLDDAALLVVSGRASFEIVQKAAVARIPCVASVSAPSTLAVDLAEACGLTLVSFVRGDSLNAYANASRLGKAPPARAAAEMHP